MSHRFHRLHGFKATQKELVATLKIKAKIGLALRGENRIRTCEPVLPVTRFPGVPLQPLEHLSLFVSGCKGTKINEKRETRNEKCCLFNNLYHFRPKTRATLSFVTLQISSSLTPRASDIRAMT